MSPQLYGSDGITELRGRPILLMHGENDEVLSPQFSRHLYSRAAEPKKLSLYPGSGHGLDECRNEIDRDLLSWLREVL